MSVVATLRPLLGTLQNIFVASGATGQEVDSTTLTSGSNLLSGYIDPTQNGLGMTRGNFVFGAGSGSFGSDPAANTALYLYALKSTDGTTSNFEVYPGSSQTPAWLPMTTIAFDGTSNTWPKVAPACDLPPVPFKVILVNSSGQTLNSGWTLNLIPSTDQATNP